LKKKIFDGDIFQAVLSKRFSAKYEGDAFSVYRALRIINPSPYMYFLECKDGLQIIGTSPEDLLNVQEGRARVLPIAGTRKRGKTDEEEKRMEEDLVADEKEIAEHTMLLDLGRNDLGRVCEYGTVKVLEKMKIKKYSHVMHLVSKVEGTLAKDKDSIDALMYCFPAGTVSGAPKIRAMELIKKVEKTDRNIYAGAVGYIDYSGNLDMCIAIRTLFAKGNTIYWQAGGGIVADSQAHLEEKEIIKRIKLKGVSVATSGDYENYFEKDGVRYHHLLDPKTGYPSKGLQSVTIIHKQNAFADGLATAVFVMGKEKGMKLIESLHETEAMIIDDKGKIFYSSGFQKFLIN
jgi:anthranilate synthase component 1